MSRYLSADEIWAINQRIQAGEGQQSVLIDRGKLEAAAMRPQTLAYYEQADLVDQAATLMVGIALAHAFLDANKRTAGLVGVLFLNSNGLQLVADKIEYAIQILDVVDATDRAVAEAHFRQWLRDHTQ